MLRIHEGILNALSHGEGRRSLRYRTFISPFVK